MVTDVIKNDEFGPEYVLRVYDAKIGLPGSRSSGASRNQSPKATTELSLPGMEGFLVIDNTALGPGKGGIRMTPNVTIEEVSRLARTMTWKNALAGIPFGGAKAGLVWPPSCAKASEGKSSGLDLKKLHVQSFARALKPLIPSKYIAGPDVNSGEKEMQWFAEAVGDWRAATGKPADFCAATRGGKEKTCGLPHELGSTGFGVAHSAKVAAEIAGLNIKGATVAIEGFGNVGTFAFKHLAEMGAKVVAVSDSRGAAYLELGLNEKILRGLKTAKKSVADYPGAKKLTSDEFFALPVDILIPAAVTDVINDGNKDKIKAKIIVEGANIPMRENVEDELFRRGVVIVPDFVANMGGVISSYAEYMGYLPEKMFELVREKVTKATREVMEKSIREKRNPREVALEIAKEKVLRAAGKRKSIL
jgi:glutamate dehydrogenase (NAD(P)+)